MNLNITFRHFNPSESIKNYAREKLERMDKYLDHASEATVVLTLERHLHGADMRIHSGTFLVRGRERHEDVFTAIDNASEKIEKQLKRYKDRIKGHHSRDSLRFHAVSVRHQVLEEPEDGDRHARKVVRRNEFLARPMSLDEAIMQLDLMDTEFYVFTNSTTMEMNVVYRRRDSTIGLIEASGVQKRSLVQHIAANH